MKKPQHLNALLGKSLEWIPNTIKESLLLGWFFVSPAPVLGDI